MSYGRINNLEANKQRLIYVDIGKAIAITLMVWGHLVQNDYYKNDLELVKFIRKVVYSYHMPLFFYLSGIVYKRRSSFKSELLYRFRKIMIFQYVAIMLVLTINILMSTVTLADAISAHNIECTLLCTNGAQVGYWFFGALFVVEIIAYFITLQNSGTQTVMAIVISVIAVEISKILPNSPFHFVTGLECLPFFVLGYLYANSKQRIEIECDSLLIVCCILLNLFLNYRYSIVSLWNSEVGNPIIFLVRGITGIIPIMAISMHIERLINKLAKFKTLIHIIGMSTSYIYVLNGYMVDTLHTVIKLTQMQKIKGYDWICPILTLASVALISILTQSVKSGLLRVHRKSKTINN